MVTPGSAYAVSACTCHDEVLEDRGAAVGDGFAAREAANLGAGGGHHALPAGRRAHRLPVEVSQHDLHRLDDLQHRQSIMATADMQQDRPVRDQVLQALVIGLLAMIFTTRCGKLECVLHEVHKAGTCLGCSDGQGARDLRAARRASEGERDSLRCDGDVAGGLGRGAGIACQRMRGSSRSEQPVHVRACIATEEPRRHCFWRRTLRNLSGLIHMIVLVFQIM